MTKYVRTTLHNRQVALKSLASSSGYRNDDFKSTIAMHSSNQCLVVTRLNEIIMRKDINLILFYGNGLA